MTSVMGVRERRDGNGFAGVHELADAGELLAELAAGMEIGEIFGAEALAEGDGDGQGVAEGEHGGGRGGGSEVEAAGLPLDADSRGRRRWPREGGLRGCSRS